MLKYTLYVYVDKENHPELYEKYQEKVTAHNDALFRSRHPDSGFDIFVPEDMHVYPSKVNKIDFQIKTAMVQKLSDTVMFPAPFYLYPRSSISKSNVRMANNVGIIDCGYRGNICGMFDVVYSNNRPWLCEQFTRLLQICTPTLEPFRVVLVEKVEELGTTERGDGGFGSTGIVG